MSENRKMQIVDAATPLFAAKGIAKVSVSKIAATVGVSRATVYYYFKKGKSDIVSEILRFYEACVRFSIPDPAEWDAADADAEQILSNLFFRFPVEDMLKLRKIVRIIMSGMFNDAQIMWHFQEHFITRREVLLSDCMRKLGDRGKIRLWNADSMARFFNRYLVVCAIEDALRYPYADGDEVLAEAQYQRTAHDFTNFIKSVLPSV